MRLRGLLEVGNPTLGGLPQKPLFTGGQATLIAVRRASAVASDSPLATTSRTLRADNEMRRATARLAAAASFREERHSSTRPLNSVRQQCQSSEEVSLLRDGNVILDSPNHFGVACTTESSGNCPTALQIK